MKFPNQARGTKVELYVPQRGDVAKLNTMAHALSSVWAARAALYP